MGATRDRWAALVGRWRQSGQTAREFAEATGVKAATLTHWAWRLKREGKGREARWLKRRRRRASAPARQRGFVELIVDGHADGRFELEFADGRRLRIPAGFDAAALERVLTILGDARR